VICIHETDGKYLTPIHKMHGTGFVSEFAVAFQVIGYRLQVTVNTIG